MLQAEPGCVKPGSAVVVSVKQRDDRFQPGEFGWLVNEAGEEWKDPMFPGTDEKAHLPYRNPDPGSEIFAGYLILPEQRWVWRRHMTVPTEAGEGQFRFVWGFYDDTDVENGKAEPATHEALVEFEVSKECKGGLG